MVRNNGILQQCEIILSISAFSSRKSRLAVWLSLLYVDRNEVQMGQKETFSYKMLLYTAMKRVKQFVIMLPLDVSSCTVCMYVCMCIYSFL